MATQNSTARTANKIFGSKPAVATQTTKVAGKTTDTKPVREKNKVAEVGVNLYFKEPKKNSYVYYNDTVSGLYFPKEYFGEDAENPPEEMVMELRYKKNNS